MLRLFTYDQPAAAIRLVTSQIPPICVARSNHGVPSSTNGSAAVIIRSEMLVVVGSDGKLVDDGGVGDPVEVVDVPGWVVVVGPASMVVVESSGGNDVVDAGVVVLVVGIVVVVGSGAVVVVVSSGGNDVVDFGVVVLVVGMVVVVDGGSSSW